MDDFSLTPLEGGFSGETFVGVSSGERTVVRIYAERGAKRGPAAAEIDAAVLRLVRGLVPVPEVLEVRRADPEEGAPAVLVTSWLPGERLDSLLPRLSAAERERVGQNVGRITARLAQMPMLRPGRFVDGELRVEPWPEASDLADWLAYQRRHSALAAWPAEEFEALEELVTRAQAKLDRIDRTCLVHSDFNPKNLLVDPVSLEVTGVVDWEFAHAGLPVTDLGNLLRFEQDEAFRRAVVETHRERVPDAGGDLLELAQAADLFALLELAGRKGENPITLAADARLRAITGLR